MPFLNVYELDLRTTVYSSQTVCMTGNVEHESYRPEYTFLGKLYI